jgi:uncharacterized membrane protein (DUF106 family)
LLIAVLLLLFDAGVRCLTIDRKDMQKAWNAIRLKRQAKRSAQEAASARSSRH